MKRQMPGPGKPSIVIMNNMRVSDWSDRSRQSYVGPFQRVERAIMDLERRRELARRFQTSLASRDWMMLRSLLADDADWKVPGNAKISGHVEGAEAIVERFASVTRYEVNFAMQNVLFSRDNFAMTFHNTATQGDRKLDMRLATICRVSRDKIGNIETFVSDVDQLNTFFV
jgi:uncharacterized protein